MRMRDACFRHVDQSPSRREPAVAEFTVFACGTLIDRIEASGVDERGAGKCDVVAGEEARRDRIAVVVAV